jgi:hypothetical protein
MICEVKQKYVQESLHLAKWYLEPDLILYSSALDYYRNKYTIK